VTVKNIGIELVAYTVCRLILIRFANDNDLRCSEAKSLKYK
jgi:hypothetical protein